MKHNYRGRTAVCYERYLKKVEGEDVRLRPHFDTTTRQLTALYWGCREEDFDGAADIVYELY